MTGVQTCALPISDTVIKAIHQLLAGQSILAGRVLEALSRMMSAELARKQRNQKSEGEDRASRAAGKQLPKDLTPRELEICGLLTKGLGNGEIAAELFLAEGTVKNYMMSIYDKFAIHDRTALVLFLKEMIG